jgi:hypothetical protein
MIHIMEETFLNFQKIWIYLILLMFGNNNPDQVKSSALGQFRFYHHWSNLMVISNRMFSALPRIRCFLCLPDPLLFSFYCGSGLNQDGFATIHVKCWVQGSLLEFFFLLCSEELTKKLDELEERAEDLDKKRNIQQPSKLFSFYSLII